MPTPKKDTTNDLENFDKDSVMTEARFVFLMKQRESNEIRLGCKVSDIETVEGSEKKNKDGHLLLDNNNQPLKYPTKYYVHLTFDGATIRSEINFEQSSSLIVGKRYYSEGRLGMVREFGKELIAPIFSNFTELLG